MRLISPETADKVLGHWRYWSRPFVVLFMARCDELAVDRPDAAVRLAAQLPELVRRVRVDDGPEAFRSAGEQRSFLALAHLMRESCMRRVGRGDYAAVDASEIERLFALGVTREVVAERLKRRALGVYEAGDAVGALRMLGHAIQTAGLRHRSTTRAAVLLRGMLRQRVFRRSALEDFGAALLLVEGTDAAGQARMLEAALAIDYDLMRFRPEPETLQAVSFMVSEARRRLAHRPAGRCKAWLYWQTGLILLRVGIDEQGVRRLNKAHQLLREVGRPAELAVVTLDLADALLCSEAEDLGDQVEELARDLGGALADGVLAEGAASASPRDETDELTRRLQSFLEAPRRGDLQAQRAACWPLLAEAVYAGTGNGGA
ncbi:MAG: hypothetical protein AAGC60_27490 [Acidobacteriota bacterium]